MWIKRQERRCSKCHENHGSRDACEHTYKMVPVVRCEGCGNPLLPREIPKHVCESARDAVYYATHRHNAWMLP